jgi:hypothetical protein
MKLKYVNWSTDIFPGFYESELYNCDTLFNITENCKCDDELKDDEYYDFVDNGYENFEKEVCEQAVDALFCSLDDAPEITGMKFIALHSPKYYNFETDKIEVEIDCDWQHILEYAQKTMRQNFDDYLHENFTSRDGFWSFVPNNAGEFFAKLDDDFERLSQVLLEYFILNHLDRDLYQERLYEIATNTIWQYIEVYKNGEPVNKDTKDDEK